MNNKKFKVMSKFDLSTYRLKFFKIIYSKNDRKHIFKVRKLSKIFFLKTKCFIILFKKITIIFKIDY
jgi:hypothetical protein